jgi:anti-sigma B factor antagonist
MMKITTDTVGDITMIRPEGPMKAEDQNQFKKVMVDLSAKGQVKVALDMSKVTFIDSSCLGILIWSMKNLRQRGGDLKMFGLADYVMEVFRITRLESCFTVTETQDQAVAEFGND